jgi:hypothetical protein
MNGIFSVKSLMISNEALPEPIIIAALKMVQAFPDDLSSSSTANLDPRCLDRCSSLAMTKIYLNIWDQG